LKAEDKFDKELKKEQKKAKKRELKEAKQANDKRNVGAKLADSDSSDEESENLDWLPDPDKYEKDETTTEIEEHKQQGKDSSVKRPKKKKAKIATDDVNLEDLALQLLKN